MNFLEFEDFLFLREHSKYTGVKLETGNQNDRLINHIAVLDESSYAEFDALTEHERYQLDDIIWECILEAATTDEELNEGFFKKIVSGVKDLPKKALTYAKKVISNIGQLFKDLVKYVKKFFGMCAKKAQGAGEKLWNEVKSSAEEKLLKRFKIVEERAFTGDVLNEGSISAKSAKEELAHWDDCKDYMSNKAVDQALKDAEGSAAEIVKGAAGKSKNEAPEMINKIDQELKGGKKSNESFGKDIIAKAINEIRSDKNFDMNELIMIAEYNTLMNEGDGADSAEEASEDKKKSLWKKIKDSGELSLSNLVAVIVSGVVWVFEMVSKYLTNGSLNRYAKSVEKAGGPKAIEYVAIGTIIAAIIGLALEIFATIFSHAHNWAGPIADALHAGNPSYWLSKAGSALIGNTTAGKVIKVIALLVAGGIGAYHILHSLKGHEHIDDKDKDDKDKDDKDKDEKKEEEK
jgi:hypothetical protein